MHYLDSLYDKRAAARQGLSQHRASFWSNMLYAGVSAAVTGGSAILYYHTLDNQLSDISFVDPIRKFTFWFGAAMSVITAARTGRTLHAYKQARNDRERLIVLDEKIKSVEADCDLLDNVSMYGRQRDIALLKQKAREGSIDKEEANIVLFEAQGLANGDRRSKRLFSGEY